MTGVLQDKLAFVSGASRGIGKAIAEELATKGAIVIGTATTEGGAEKITENLHSQGFSGKGLRLDVSDPESIELALKTAQESFQPIDILVNNAAITQDTLMIRMKEEQWQSVIETNLTSVFRLSKACLRHMMKARWGRIINISSVAGFAGNPGQTNYAAAKAGLIGFTKSLALEVATRGITVNAVAPGFIETDMTKDIPEEHAVQLRNLIAVKRLGKPEEIASAVGFLAQPAAAYITGETIHVNGGMYMD